MDERTTEVTVEVCEEEFTFDTAAELLIDRDDLDDAFAKQGAKYAWFAVKHEIARTERVKLESKLEVHEAKLDEELRLKAAASADKMTEVKLKAAIKRDPKRVEIVDKIADKESDERILNALAYAFAQRKDLLIALGRSRNTELSSPSEVKTIKDWLQGRDGA